MLNRFHRIPVRNGQTDRQTDRITISISHVRVPMCDKNCTNNYTHLSSTIFTQVAMELSYEGMCFVYFRTQRHAIERASSDLVHWPSLATGNIVHSSTSKSVSISLTLFLLWILSILTKSYKNLHWKCITSEQHQNAHFGNALSRPAGRAYPHAPQTS